MSENNNQTHHTPSLAEKIVGIIFAFLVFALVSYTIVMDVNVDDKKINLLYTLIALMSGIFVATIPGFLNIDYSTKGMTMRAAGGAAAFVLVLFSLQQMSSSPKKEVVGGDKTTTGTITKKATLFNATSYCSMRNVYGYGTHKDVTEAQNIAIRNCINNGGIPNCCSSYVRVNQANQ